MTAEAKQPVANNQEFIDEVSDGMKKVLNLFVKTLLFCLLNIQKVKIKFCYKTYLKDFRDFYLVEYIIYIILYQLVKRFIFQ